MLLLLFPIHRKYNILVNWKLFHDTESLINAVSQEIIVPVIIVRLPVSDHDHVNWKKSGCDYCLIPRSLFFFFEGDSHDYTYIACVGGGRNL